MGDDVGGARGYRVHKVPMQQAARGEPQQDHRPVFGRAQREAGARQDLRGADTLRCAVRGRPQAQFRLYR